MRYLGLFVMSLFSLVFVATLTNLCFAASSLSGYVYKNDGTTPIAEATIELLLVEGGGPLESAITGEEGYYNFSSVESEKYRLRVSAPGYAREYYDNVVPSHEASVIELNENESRIIDFTLSLGGKISGKIFGEDGVTPIEGAHVRVTPSKYFFDDGFGVLTNVDGNYVVEGLALGQYKVTASATGYASLKYYSDSYGWGNAEDIVVTPPQVTTGINISLELAGSISGHVYAHDGITPLEVTLIADPTIGHFEGIGTQSNPNGSYTIHNLPPDQYTLRVENTPGWYVGEFYNAKPARDTADTIPVEAGEDTANIDFTLDEGGVVTGQVFDKETGQPISGVQLGAFNSNGGGIASAPVVKQDGTFNIQALPGVYTINVFWAHGYLSEWYNGAFHQNEATPVEVRLHEETSGINFFLTKTGSVSGNVLGEDGNIPLQDAALYAFPINDQNVGSGANTSPDGSYVIEGLASGTYVVKVVASGHVMKSRQVTVNSPDDTPNIDFLLAPYPYVIQAAQEGIVSPDGGAVVVTELNSPIMNAQVEIPTGALQEHTLIAISEIIGEIEPLSDEGESAGNPVHFGPEDHVFSEPVLLKIPYNQNLLNTLGVSGPSVLDVFTLNISASSWEKVLGAKIVDVQTQTIGIYVNHFSIFQVGIKTFSLKHAIMIAKTLCGMQVTDFHMNSDLTNNQKIEMNDLIGILQKIADLR